MVKEARPSIDVRKKVLVKVGSMEVKKCHWASVGRKKIAAATVGLV